MAIAPSTSRIVSARLTVISGSVRSRFIVAPGEPTSRADPDTRSRSNERITMVRCWAIITMYVGSQVIHPVAISTHLEASAAAATSRALRTECEEWSITFMAAPAASGASTLEPW